MGVRVQQSFERRLKRKGIQLRLSSHLTDEVKKKKLDQFKGLDFWIWNKTEHERKYHEWIHHNARPCCFQHPIGLPHKNGIPKPLFEYEKEIYDALQEIKYVWIKKATGLGITEFMLRYIAWLCLKDDKLKGSQMCIVTGPRIELAITLINRLKGLFSDIKFEDKETVCELNGIRIEAFPSHHLDSMRGLDRVSLILLDEGDFFPMGQQQEARAISERYIAKSANYIIMVSTPNRPEGLFEQIEREPAGKCLYHRIFLPYHVGLAKIYKEEEIAKARESPQFPREYDLQYIGQEGNVLNHESIERAISAGLEVNKEYPIDEIPQDTNKSIGIDAGFGSSKFAIVVTQLLRKEGKIQVLYAEEFERPDFGTMVEKIVKMYRNYTVSKIYIDNANPEVITAIKAGLSERTDYDKQIAHWKSVNRYYKPETYMKVIPVSFSSNGREMLAHTKYCLDNSWLAIHPNFHKLIIALRTAVATDGLLDKQVTAYNDVLDAFRLSLSFYKSTI
ncbi:MAG TPA: hypothetical protein VKA09_16270 [Nitrososphaeraceae archaeon]|nr:hypothetical protein [Nitrososphaeraceae archaeon]